MSRWTSPITAPLGSRCLVRRVQAACSFRDRPRAIGRGHHVRADIAQRQAGDVLHHHVERAALFAEVVHGRDAGMVEPREDRGLVEEHRADRRCLCVLGPDRLDRDELLERARAAPPREEHRTHAATLELEQDLVRAELGAGPGHGGSATSRLLPRV